MITNVNTLVLIVKCVHTIVVNHVTLVRRLVHGSIHIINALRNAMKICDCPRCNHPCKHTLQCKHPCIGVCGESCPRICRIKKRKKRFHNLCEGISDTKNKTRYIQLSCDHLFKVKMLDQLLDGQFKENTMIQPLVCLSCRKQINSTRSYKYGDLNQGLEWC